MISYSTFFFVEFRTVYDVRSIFIHNSKAGINIRKGKIKEGITKTGVASQFPFSIIHSIHFV